MDDHKELAENHKRIWLAPRCEVDERTWCQDDQGCCDECSEEWIEYVRADITKAEVERLVAERRAAERNYQAAHDLQNEKIERLRAALKPIAKIHLWRDVYPDGPDIVTDDKLTFVTPDQVREARALCASEQKEDKTNAG